MLKIMKVKKILSQNFGAYNFMYDIKFNTDLMFW